MPYDCPQCGESTETLHEGYCADCCAENQVALDKHNAEFYAWQNMTDLQRDKAIRRSVELNGIVVERR